MRLFDTLVKSIAIVKLTTCIFLFAIALFPPLRAEQPEPFPKPVFTLAGHTLSIKLGDDTYLIEGVHYASNPSMRWSAEELYHPKTHMLAVPMADESYHIFDLDKVMETSDDDRPVPECIIEGGVAGFRGNYWRSRRHWHFTNWLSLPAKTKNGPLRFVGREMKHDVRHA